MSRIKTFEDAIKEIERLENHIHVMVQRESVVLHVPHMDTVSISHLQFSNTVRIAHSNPSGSHHQDIPKEDFAKAIQSMIDTPWESRNPD